MAQVAQKADRIGFLFGADEQSGLFTGRTGSLVSPGNTDARMLRSGDPADFVRLHIPGNFQRVKRRPSLSTVKTVVNLVSDPDLNPKVLGHAEKFLKAFGGRVLNPPRKVMKTGRAAIAALLADVEGLVVPRVARFRGHPAAAAAAIDRAGIAFPAILRQAGLHAGRIVDVVTDRSSVFATLDPNHHYYLTEFVDLPREDGLYHKIRLLFFGPQAVIRHRIVSDHWNVHGPDRERVQVRYPAAIAAERALIDQGLDGLPAPARRAMLAIRERIALDFFGVDFALLPDGRAVLFEANATMDFFPVATERPFDYFGPTLARAQAAFDALIEGVERPRPVPAMFFQEGE